MIQNQKGAVLHVTGVVQGVGFRPFVYNLARKFCLSGWVRNTSSGVVIEVDGSEENLTAFHRALTSEAPPLAVIDDVRISYQSPRGHADFLIQASQSVEGAFQPISPDVSVCPDCLGELLDPQNRRYRYPFINCTNCGPRFTIIRDIPYDRPQTTMAPFPMCPECAAEYNDPQDRRFHAQPVACPVCGPHLWIEYNHSPAGPLGVLDARTDALVIQDARRMLAEGNILAVKGLGGFHLACDATNPRAVAELRKRKIRTGKPFALMVADLQHARRFCDLDAVEEGLLLSIQRPVVILKRKPGTGIAGEVAPGQDTLGVFLPYTPLHTLLLEPSPAFPAALVMTSANVSEEPIACANAEARQRLASLADAYLMHDRDIHVRCDDSVVRRGTDRVYPLRRSRGYAPLPVALPWDGPSVFAAGTGLKNTFCLTRDRYAFLSHHIGDLQNYETLKSYEDGVRHFENLFRIQPQIISYDLHPDYLATRYALERSSQDSLPAIGVQHHHAHLAACMAENRLPADETVIGVAFDGTGYGTDGAIWGGEILLANYTTFERRFHLRSIPLPGGDLAVLEPYRLALAWLEAGGIPWDTSQPPFAYLAGLPAADQKTAALRRQIQSGLNAVPTTSMGRLFDAAAALLGVRLAVNYEAQAAIELEALAGLAPAEAGVYDLDVSGDVIDPLPLIRGILADMQAKTPLPVMAARFHNSLAELVGRTCDALRQETGVSRVALSGGVWQNVTLLRLANRRLTAAGFDVLIHQKVPANDGGVALGQAAVAIQRFNRGML